MDKLTVKHSFYDDKSMYNIVKGHLVNTISTCGFGKYCTPEMIEKLATEIPESIRDFMDKSVNK